MQAGSGYRMWTTAILIAYEIEKREGLFEFHMGMYSLIARKHKSTFSKTESAMRYCVDQKQNNIQKYFEYSNKVANKTFCHMLFEKVKLLMQQQIISKNIDKYAV